MNEIIQQNFFEPVLPYITEMERKDGEYIIHLDFRNNEVKFDQDILKKYFKQSRIINGVNSRYNTDCDLITFTGTFIDDNIAALVYNMWTSRFETFTVYEESGRVDNYMLDAMRYSLLYGGRNCGKSALSNSAFGGELRPDNLNDMNTLPPPK